VSVAGWDGGGGGLGVRRWDSRCSSHVGTRRSSGLLYINWPDRMYACGPTEDRGAPFVLRREFLPPDAGWRGPCDRQSAPSARPTSRSSKKGKLRDETLQWPPTCDSTS